jgi:hypothetical protein
MCIAPSRGSALCTSFGDGQPHDPSSVHAAVSPLLALPSSTCGRPVTASYPSGEDLADVAEAVYTLAAVILATAERQPADLAAKRVVQIRHEVRHAFSDWAPPPDSYRARDLPREP